VTELRSHAAEFEKAGANLVIIGNGWPGVARKFAEQKQLPKSMTLLTDKSQKAYQAAGLKRGLWRTLGPQSWLPYLKTLARGFRQRRTAGDPWQQGGALVLEKGGQVSFRPVREHPGDQARAAELLEAVRKSA
jgi:hypothetical protein